MKIAKLHFPRFGHFTDFSLSFEGEAPGLHIIYGANEAGKTTMLRGIKRFFSGFKVQDPESSFLHAKETLRVGMDLSSSDGHALLYRRKGRVRTLLDCDNQPVEEALLLAFLGGLDPSVYVSRFTLSHEELREAGRALLKGKGDVGESLFTAGLGTPALRKLIQSLEDERSSLFKARGSKPRINVGLKRFKELSQLVKTHTVKPKDLDALEQEVQSLEQLLETHQKALKENAIRRGHLSRMQLLLPAVARLHDAENQRSELGALPAIPDDCRALRVAAQAARQTLTGKIKDETTRLKACRDRLAGLKEDPALLKAGPALKRLEDNLARLTASRDERRNLEAKVEQALQAAEKEATMLMPGKSLDDVLKLYPGRPKSQSIRLLGSQEKALVDRIGEGTQRLQESRRNLEEGESALLAQPRADSDPATLKVVLKEYRVLEGRNQSLQGDLSQLSEQTLALNDSVARLFLKGGTVGQFLGLILPDEETLRRRGTALETLQREDEDLGRQQKELEQSVLDVEGEKKGLEHGGLLPSEADLDTARGDRDNAFRLIQNRWSEGVTYGESVASSGDGKTLVSGYTHALTHADGVVDTLRAESDRVAQSAQIQGRLVRLRHQLEGLLTRRSGLRVDHQQALSAWAEQFEEFGLIKPSPQGLASWLSLVETLRQKGEALGSERRRTAALSQEIEDAKRVVGNVLFQFSGQRFPSLPLSFLFQEAEVRLRTAEEQAAKRGKLVEAVDRHRLEVKRAQDALTLSAESHVSWKDDWERAIGSLAAQGNASPEVVLTLLTHLEGIWGDHQEAQRMAAKIQEIDGEEVAFRGELNDFLAVYDPEAVGQSEAVSVANLRKRYGSLDKAHGQRVDLLKDEAERVKRLEDFENELKSAKGTLSQLVSISGVEEMELPDIERRCALKKELESRIEGERKIVLTAGGGLPLEDIQRDVADVAIDALKPELDELDFQSAQLKTEESTARESLGAKRRDLEELKGGEGAILAAEEQAEVAGRIRSLAERYVSLTVAKNLIQQEVERYRKANQGPILSTAQTFFTQLTLGSFSQLLVDYDARDAAILMGVRPDGRQVGVEGMSDGTQDQLYLALRLATLKMQAKKGASLPIVVDDILINADDIRAKAGLSLLAEFAEHTQVLFFTHHRRMVELAGELDLGETVHIYEI